MELRHLRYFVAVGEEQHYGRAWVLNPTGCLGAIETAILQQRPPITVAVRAEGNDVQLSLVARGVGLGP